MLQNIKQAFLIKKLFIYLSKRNEYKCVIKTITTMKKNLKFWLVALVCTLFTQTPAMADNDKPVTVEQLPAAAQQFIKANFADRTVSIAKMESGLIEKSYDVLFTNGDRVEFDRNGNWTEVQCPQTAVPASVVPAQVADYVKKAQAAAKIVKIEKDRSNTEVSLSNGVELTFNKNYQVVDIDL